jgi:hypothetical protein
MKRSHGKNNSDYRSLASKGDHQVDGRFAFVFLHEVSFQRALVSSQKIAAVTDSRPSPIALR